MEGEYRMIASEHTMDGMAQFMSHRRNVARISRVVEQYVRSQSRHYAVAIGAPDFSRPRSRIDMPFGKDLLGKVGETGRKGAVGFQHHCHCISVFVLLGFGTVGRVQMITTHRPDVADSGFELEIGLKYLCISSTYGEQHLDGAIRYVISEISSRDGR